MFTAVFIHDIEIWKQHKCPPTDGQIKMCNTHTDTQTHTHTHTHRHEYYWIGQNVLLGFLQHWKTGMNFLANPICYSYCYSICNSIKKPGKYYVK